MPSRPAPGTSFARYQLWGLTDQKEFQCDFWYSVSAGTITPWFDGPNAGSAFLTNIATPLLDCLTAETFLRGCTVELSDGSVNISTQVYQNMTGTIALDRPLPGDVAAVVQKITATPGKIGRGRWYLPMVPEGFTDGSYLNSTGRHYYEVWAVAAKTLFTVTAHVGSFDLSPAHFSPNTGLLYPIVQDPVVGLLGTKRRRRGPF